MKPNPKYENRNSKQILNPNYPNKPLFGIWNFVLRICFVFRI